MRPPLLRLSLDELVVDSFAGGGGASTGIEAALGRSVDIAINHDPEAIEMHRRNHPGTKHYLENVWRVDPKEATQGRPVGLAWFSPDCTHFSRAKGQQPVKKSIRGLAWVVIRWAIAVRPRVIILENVPEFQTWGPVVDSRPDPKRAGATFRAWSRKLRSLGYELEYRTLVAADYGTPTTRRRLFLVARCDGLPIVWPDPTHGRGLQPWRPAADIIDWSIPCPSIFDRPRPLADATLRRIAEGIRRYVVEAADPFITKHYGGVVGHDVGRPLGTVTSKDHHALTSAFLTKFYGTSTGASMQMPLPTVTANGRGGGHLAEVRALLIGYYSNGGSQQQSLFDPMHTITGKARFGLVTVHGEPYQIVDIGMRMLQPRELFNAQGFPGDYLIDGLTKTAQISLAGNSVCPQVAEAIVRANCLAREERRTA